MDSARLVCARAPVRIDFAGGWTDVAEYARDEPGVVLNVAITCHTYALARPLPAGSHAVRIRSADFGLEVEAPSVDALVYDGELDLLKGALRALAPPGSGLEVAVRSVAPPGSGLGTSASACVALLAALDRLGGGALSRRDLAELACRIEREDLGIRGGKQDQYASAFGGFSLLRFDGAEVTRTPLSVPEDLQRELHRRLVLCYTGRSRLSGENHQRVAEAYAAGNAVVHRALAKLKGLTWQMHRALLAGALEEMGELLQATWRAQKMLCREVTNRRMERLFRVAAEAGAVGGKACGAGGGGCLLFLARPDRVVDLRSALRRADARIIEFEFDLRGVQTWTARDPAR